MYSARSAGKVYAVVAMLLSYDTCRRDGAGLGGSEDGVGVVERRNGGSVLVEVRRGSGYDIEREGLWRGFKACTRVGGDEGMGCGDGRAEGKW